MEKNDDCWDLFAVVRSCRVATRSPPPPPPLPEPIIPCSFQELTESSHLELEKLWNPSFFVSQQPKPTPLSCSSPSASAATVAVTPRFMKQTRPLSQTKRRKKQQKRDVRQVRADGLAADMWAWRKYGQKPIKGSPYPRGYYRCSSSKGCLARKQVERSQIDPGMFVITYSGEHNHPLPTHRNSLAGTTRQKLPLPGVSGEQGNSSEEEVLLKKEEECCWWKTWRLWERTRCSSWVRSRWMPPPLGRKMLSPPEGWMRISSVHGWKKMAAPQLL